jgi:hypothetical protein
MRHVTQYCDTLPNRLQKIAILPDFAFVGRSSARVIAKQHGTKIGRIATGNKRPMTIIDNTAGAGGKSAPDAAELKIRTRTAT